MASDAKSSWWRPRAWLASAERMFGTDVWKPRLEELPRGKALFYRASRIAYSTVTGYHEDRLPFRAAALTYYTILSIVPFLAFAFAVLKGFGAYGTFVRNVVEPYVRENFGGNPALTRAVNQVLGFVTKTDVSGLGITGLVFLAYTSVNLLVMIEIVLNELWGFGRSRSWLRRVTDYVTLVVVTPMLVLVAVTFGAAAQSSQLAVFLRERLGLGSVIDFLLRFTSFLGACVAVTALLLIMPNGKVRTTSALIGGLVGGVLWQVA